MRHRIGFLVLSVALACGAMASAESLRIHGRILGRGGVPLEGDVTAVGGRQNVTMASYRSDAQGMFSFSLETAPGETVLLVAKADGYVSAEKLLSRPPAQRPIEFVLSPAGNVSGRILDETGVPVVDATVRPWYPGERRSYTFDDETGDVTTDSLGYFALPLVAQGKPFMIQAEADNRLPVFSGMLVSHTKEMKGVTVILPRKGEMVRVTVLDRAGTAAADVGVYLLAEPAADQFTAEERRTPGFVSSTSKNGRTGSDGTFAFRGVPVGKIAILASVAGSPRAKVEGLVSPGRGLDLVLQLP